MAILEQKTDLKSLKNSLYGAKDLLTPEDINDPPKAKGLALQVTKRVDDLTRHVKLLTRKQGLKFVANQALLNQVDTISKIRDAKKSGKPGAVGAAIKDQLKKTAINTVGATASLLAQIPLNGTGIFIPRGIVPVTYLKTGGALKDDTANPNIFKKVASKIKEVRGDAEEFTSLLDNRPTELSKYKGGSKTGTFQVDPSTLGAAQAANKGIKPENRKQDFYESGEKGRFVNDEDKVEVLIEAPDGKGGIKELTLSKEIQDEVAFSNDSDKRLPPVRTKSKANDENYKVDGTDWASLNNPIVLYRPGALREKDNEDNRPDPIQSHDDTTATILNTDNQDIIPFEFNTFYPGNTDGYFLAFRAFLNSLNDNFSGDWAGTKYVGRADELYTYQGFKRAVDFSFKVAAFSKADLVPLYDKINLLAGSTAPTYNDQGEFMKGTLTKITIADYLKDVTGFISSVGLSWDVNSPWEINSDKGTPRVPHILSVAISFTPIHDFIPTATSRYIA